MRARLYSPVGDVQVDHHFGAEAVIGRSPQSTIEVPLTLVSGRHARIAWDAERECYVLEDLGSSNGTLLDGEPVTEPRPLGHLHVITLSEHYDFVFQDLDRCVARHGSDRAGAAPTMHTSVEVLDLPLPGSLQPKQASSKNASSKNASSRTGAKKADRHKTLFGRFDLPLPDMLRGDAAAQDATETPDESEAGTENDVSTDRLQKPDRTSRGNEP